MVFFLDGSKNCLSGGKLLVSSDKGKNIFYTTFKEIIRQYSKVLLKKMLIIALQ